MRRKKKSGITKTVIISFMVLVSILIGTIFFGSSEKVSAKEKTSVTSSYQVTATCLNVRSQSNTNCKILGHYYKGNVVQGEMLSSNWLKISYNGKDAYLSGDYLKAIKVTDPDENISSNDVDSEVRYKTTAYLNVRKGPGTSYERIGTLAISQVINPVSVTSNNWYEIEYNGEKAYVCGDYVTTYTPLLNSDGMTDDPYDYIIVVNSKNCTLNVYYQNALWHEFDCGPGKLSTPTPEGCFTIANKFVNPTYKNIPGGASNNPLGKRWMGLSVPGTGGGTYGIHGNCNEDSIGKNVSAGCVRMHNDEVEALYDVIPIGTTVIVQFSDSDDITIAAEYGFTLTN